MWSWNSLITQLAAYHAAWHYIKITYDDKRPFSFHVSNDFKPCWDFSRAMEETIIDLNMQVGTQFANKQLNNEPGQKWQELEDIYLAALAVSTL